MTSACRPWGRSVQHDRRHGRGRRANVEQPADVPHGSRCSDGRWCRSARRRVDGSGLAAAATRAEGQVATSPSTPPSPRPPQRRPGGGRGGGQPGEPGRLRLHAGLTAATANKLGTVPPAVAKFATTVKSQHTQHAAAWNGVLAGAGKKKITVTNPPLDPDDPGCLRQGHRHHRVGPVGAHPGDGRRGRPTRRRPPC